MFVEIENDWNYYQKLLFEEETRVQFNQFSIFNKFDNDIGFICGYFCLNNK